MESRTRWSGCHDYRASRVPVNRGESDHPSGVWLSEYYRCSGHAYRRGHKRAGTAQEELLQTPLPRPFVGRPGQSFPHLSSLALHFSALTQLHQMSSLWHDFLRCRRFRFSSVQEHEFVSCPYHGFNSPLATDSNSRSSWRNVFAMKRYSR
jgi:hypothetical protein